MSKIREIIESFFKQEQSEEVSKRFLSWFFHPSAMKEKEEVLDHLWEELEAKADLSTEKSFREIERRLGFTKQKTIQASLLRWAQIAAILIVPLLSVGLAGWYVQKQEPEELLIVECFVPDGETREVILPDQSVVTVNSGSSLFYPREFKGKVRDIYLSGEAKFSVQPDKEKPFIVKTNDMNVEALGTVFNVSSYPDSENTTATLAEGKIKVDLKSGNDSFILSPEEQIVYNRKTGRSVLRKTRVDYVLAWEKGQMVFQGASLYSVIKEIERHYNVKVYLNTKDLSEERLTVKFLYNESLEDVLHALQQIVAGFKYKIDGNKVYIY